MANEMKNNRAKTESIMEYRRLFLTSNKRYGTGKRERAKCRTECAEYLCWVIFREIRLRMLTTEILVDW